MTPIGVTSADFDKDAPRKCAGCGKLASEYELLYMLPESEYWEGVEPGPFCFTCTFERIRGTPGL